MKLRQKVVAATAALILSAGVSTAPAAGAQPPPGPTVSAEQLLPSSWEEAMENPLSASAIMGSLGIPVIGYFFVLCPIMMSSGGWENDGRCTF